MNAPRPESFPVSFKHGRYTATFDAVSERFPGDALACATWTITRVVGSLAQVVGSLSESDAYGWGRPCFCLSKLVWAGRFPVGADDPKSQNYGMLFDGVAFESYEKALEAFARAADRLIEWRQRNP